MTDTQTRARIYLRSRAEFRTRTVQSFLSGHPQAGRVVSAANELVAALCLFASRKNFVGLEHGMYIAGLLVSFCRTHFICIELIAQGELIEAGTLGRKQMELVSRLKELRSGSDIEALIGQTPNVKHLTLAIRRRYSEYSEIAHSSHPRSLSLLGRLTQGENEYTPFYPVFDRNAYAALSDTGFVVVEFALWVTRFYQSAFSEYDAGEYDDFVRRFWTVFSEFLSEDASGVESSEVAECSPSAPASEAPPLPSPHSFSPLWSAQGVCGRADFLALAALFEFRRTELDWFERVVLPSDDAVPDAELSANQLRDRACRLALARAYQQAIGCINFVAHATQAELTGEQTVDELFHVWARSIGIGRSMAELEAQSVAELEDLERQYEAHKDRPTQR